MTISILLNVFIAICMTMLVIYYVSLYLLYYVLIKIYCAIFSVIPLLRDSAGILMQRQPRQLDSLLPSCYRRVKICY